MTDSAAASNDLDADVDRDEPQAAESRESRHFPLAILLIVGGALGLLASFSLTLDDFTLLSHPSAQLGCSINTVVQCGKNIQSWQGRVFGFPNPLLGLMMFPAPVIVGVAMLGKVRFPHWFWAIFNLGMWFAIGFVGWLSSESIFVIGTLCPWCSLVYAVVIPMWLAVTLHNLSTGLAGRPLQRVGRALNGWIPLLTLAGYLIIAVEAQLKLDLLGSFFN